MPESLVAPRDALEDGQKSQRLSHMTLPSGALYLERERGSGALAAHLRESDWACACVTLAWMQRSAGSQSASVKRNNAKT